MFLYISAGTAKLGTTYEGESGLVGDVDPRGFGVGIAGGNVKPNVTALVGGKRTKSRKSRERESAGQKSQAGGGRSDVQEKSSSPIPSEASLTPPPKSTAFEDFKKERGSEINRILNENKGKYSKFNVTVKEESKEKKKSACCVVTVPPGKLACFRLRKRSPV